MENLLVGDRGRVCDRQEQHDLEEAIKISIEDEGRVAALFGALHRGDAEGVLLLVNAGVDLNRVDKVTTSMNISIMAASTWKSFENAEWKHSTDVGSGRRAIGIVCASLWKREPMSNGLTRSVHHGCVPILDND